MKLTAKVKLLASDEQRDALLQTIQIANEACNYISDYACVIRSMTISDSGGCRSPIPVHGDR